MTEVERARAAWGPAAPDWVLLLAESCDVDGRGTVQRRIGYGATTLSQVLSNKYGASLEKVERAVRDSFAGKTVACPGLQGEQIDALRCRELQQMKPARCAGNPSLSRVWRACRAGCPHSYLVTSPDKETEHAQ